ncbi:P4HA [Mytilus edulis]|uniref:P4HA n=1 Tax=Mytilus edulis TaxID=6550 RepID=A0A8S3RUD0_MYTED|nr:P4HA [Mytilus edulis]
MDLILLHTIIMKRFMIFSYFCVSLLHVCHIHGEIFSSVYKLSIISKEEGKLLSAFNKYISTQARDQKPISFELQRLFNDLEPIVTESSHINFRLLNDLEPIVTESFYINFRLLNDLEPIVTESSQDPRYAEHPINAFHLIGRFVYKWPVVYSSILCEDCVLDKATAVQALLRLRTFYYFNIDEAINGVLFDEHCQPLNPSQVLKIVSIAKDSSMLNEARLWSEALLRRLPFTSFLDENVNEASILKVLSSIYEQAGLYHKASAILGNFIKDDKKGHSEVLDENEQNDINEEEEADISFVREEYDDSYKQLCRENRKASELHEENGIYNMEIAVVDLHSIKYCSRAFHEMQYDPKESSKLYCYISDTVIPYYKGKVEIANLQPKIFLFHDVISEREALHLRNEGSKEEKPLWGPISEDEPDDLRGTGDRIATWLFYGGAAFWYNLLPSGVTDNRTMHAGCPVVIGSKWGELISHCVYSGYMFVP